jgi:RNA polymerase sigma-70 factor (ECF subfamily)
MQLWQIRWLDMARREIMGSMAEETSFVDLIRRIRARDPEAAAELLRQYEPAVRLEVRMRLRDGRLRRLVDSLDICGSVLGSFFVRAAAGQYDLEQPEQLLRLLVKMARHKVADLARFERRQRRDIGRAEGLTAAHAELPAVVPGPEQIVACRELLEQFRGRLTEPERQLADLRAQHHTWDEIAAIAGGTADGRRMQLARALDRVARELGIDESGSN